MKRLLSVCVLVCAVVVMYGCSSGESADTLYTRGHAAWDTLTVNPGVNTEQVRAGYESLREFLQRFPEDARADSALFMMAWCQGALGQRRQAADVFIQFYQRKPDHPLSANCLILSGQIFDENREYEKARECYRQLIRRFPEHEFVQGGSAAWLLNNIGRPADSLEIPFFEPDSASTVSGQPPA